MDAALIWLEGKKPAWGVETYQQYRRALYRLEKYLRCGEISSDIHCGRNHFAYRDADVASIKLSDNYRLLHHKFYKFALNQLAKKTADRCALGCADFLLFIWEQGCKMPSEMTIELPLAYLQRLREAIWSDEVKQQYAEGVRKFLTYLSQAKYIPSCYDQIMSTLNNENIIESLKLKGGLCTGVAFQPSKPLESYASSFLSNIEELRYNAPQQEMYRYTLTSFFLFLEINHIAYSNEAAEHWLNYLPRNKQWNAKRNMIIWFADYMESGNMKKLSCFTQKPLLINSLKEWSRKIIEGYLTLRKKEGLELASIELIRSSCVRFFRFIDSKGINSPDAITPQLVKDFHNIDPHKTPRAANVYGVRVRNLLKHMGEESIVPQNLYLAISVQSAPKSDIVTIMCEDMVSAVYSYRSRAESPLELRNTAMVMLGLRMGLRASDIVNLKVGDFDWDKRTVTFIQKKTKKEITLSLLTDVGNSVYKYIRQGRPESGLQSAGFVFAQSKAPYSNLSRNICIHALERILSESGLKLPYGQGFHITRRTFATMLLRAGTKVDAITDVLGHTTRDTVNDYLAHDNENMLLCPLPFSVIGGAL
jgi:site-specific recombinase XerD